MVEHSLAGLVHEGGGIIWELGVGQEELEPGGAVGGGEGPVGTGFKICTDVGVGGVGGGLGKGVGKSALQGTAVSVGSQQGGVSWRRGVRGQLELNVPECDFMEDGKVVVKKVVAGWIWVEVEGAPVGQITGAWPTGEGQQENGGGWVRGDIV